MIRRKHSYDDAAVERLTNSAIEESLGEIERGLSLRFGSPLQKLIAELGQYARHLQTWSCDAEETGDVRPLKELLNDAALTLHLQSRGEAA